MKPAPKIYTPSIIALLLVGLWAVPCRAAQPVNELPYPNRGPQAQALGNDSFVLAWQGLLQNRNRVLLKRIAGGQAGIEEIADSGVPGEHLAPQLAADGPNLHLAWVLRVDGVDTIVYGRETATGRFVTPVATLPRPSLCAALALAADGRGGARVAWQARYADLSEVFLAEIDADGNAAPAEFQSADPLTQYHIYPQVFRGGAAPLLWYRSDAAGVRLMGAAPGANGVWREFPADELLPGLNPDCLPILCQSEAGELIAAWYELVNGADRVFLCRQGRGGAPRIVDERPGENNRIPRAAVLPNGEIAVAWIGETQNGSAIFLRIGNRPQLLVPESAGFLNNARQACTDPQLACDPHGNILVVWQSDDYHTGAGQIYHALIAAP